MWTLFTINYLWGYFLASAVFLTLRMNAYRETGTGSLFVVFLFVFP